MFMSVYQRTCVTSQKTTVVIISFVLFIAVYLLCLSERKMLEMVH